MLRRRAIIICVAALGGFGVAAESASAASVNFCGRVIASNNGWGDATGQCTGPESYRWTYVSSSYSGGGNIDRIKARMIHSDSRMYFAYAAHADNATAVAICYYGVFGWDYPVVAQHEDSGASHTIYGYADQVTNRVNCSPEGI